MVTPCRGKQGERRGSLSLPGASTQNQYIFVLPNSLELEQEMKARLAVLRKMVHEKKNIAFQYIGMFAGE
jgi:predicted DNA-binding transcriptional regulator YafY